MASLESSLCVSGTTLERPGGVPLVAVEATQDGRLVSAAVIDPLEMDVESLEARRGPDGRLVLHADVTLDRELGAVFGTARVA